MAAINSGGSLSLVEFRKFISFKVELLGLPGVICSKGFLKVAAVEFYSYTGVSI